MRTLKYGCKGEDVRCLQYLLDIKMDGSFGPNTEKALKEKQKELGLDDDGCCGPLTRKALNITDYMVWIFDPKKDKLWVAGTPYGSSSYPLKSLSKWCKEENADEVWNLAFFNPSGTGKDQYGPIKGRTLTYVRSKGKDVGYGGTEEKLYFDSKNGFAGYKLAVKDGVKKNVSSVGSRARNANGQLKDGRFFIVQSLLKHTEKHMVDHMMANYDIETMLIQDGGGSVGFYCRRHNGLIACEKEGTNGRAVATVICRKKK